MITGITRAYAPRPIRYLGLLHCNDWRIKTYSISVKRERVDEATVEYVRTLLPGWLAQSKLHDLPTYRIGTLMLHEGREGCFAIISWWIDENMLQQFVYLATNPEYRRFELFSHNGIFTCVWEMAVLWFERNAWVQHVMKAHNDPNAFQNYLAQHFGSDDY